MKAFPTPYADVNTLLNRLLASARPILNDQFVGMYLYGSLSSGDFDIESSDIDFFSEAAPAKQIAAQLEDMHEQIWATAKKYAGKLEGAYVPRDLIRRHDPDASVYLMVNEQRFYLGTLGSDWIIQRHVVRDYGVIVEGPDPKMLIDYVSPDEIRIAVMGLLREWWFPMLENDKWLRDHPLGNHSYAILSMCRALHALEHGTIVSKPVAA
jgi:predicted nucleotidyltransferase